MKALLVLAEALAKETIVFGAGALGAGALGLELASRTKEPLRTPLQAHAFPTLAAGIALFASGISVAANGPQPIGY